jgi:protein-S-isoprenylcysteine O-methyltransferase Ste14
MKWLELRIPPVALVIISAAAMWLLAKATAALTVTFPGRYVAAALLAALGLAVTVAGVVAFQRARTTVNPTTPEATSSIVRTGVYGWTRNPMYLGFLLLLCAWALMLANVAALVILPVFAFYMTRFQIAPEERALLDRFGADYADYVASVRRWL